MNKDTIGYLFESIFKKNIKEMPLNKFIDVSEYNIGIESYNHSERKVEFNRINKIIRKDNVKGIEIKGNDFKVICSLNHRIFIKKDGIEEYLEIKDIDLKNSNVCILNKYGEWVELKEINYTEDEVEILDIEVDKVHNYFSDGVLSHNSYGDPTVTTGGEAWAFYARTRIKTSVSKGETGENAIHKFTQVKSNYGKRDCLTETTITYGQGFDKTRELLQLCVDEKIIEKGGAWYNYQGVKWQGADNVVDSLNDNPELMDELYEKLRELKIL